MGSACTVSDPPPIPHVWFDSEFPAGTGGDETTVRVTGLTTFNITVADADAAQRQQILDSIRPVTTDTNGCPAREDPPRKWGSARAGAALTSMSVCAYATRSMHGPFYLYYSTRIGAASAQQAVTLIEAAQWPAKFAFPLCGVGVDRGVVSVQLVGHRAGSPLRYEVDLYNCGGWKGYRGASGLHPMTQESARLWAVDGIPVYVGTPESLSAGTPSR
jgi:hypothetical protein